VATASFCMVAKRARTRLENGLVWRTGSSSTSASPWGRLWRPAPANTPTVRAGLACSTVLAPALAIVSTVFASVAPTPNASCHDRGRTGHGGGPRNRPPA